jgi:AcrR family transcriptional regulator
MPRSRSTSDDVPRRQSIVNEALDLFAERPYEEVSIDDVCDRAGVAHGLVSYHFGGKRGLFAASIEQAWNDLVEYERPLGDERTAVERVRGYLDRHFEFVRRFPGRYAFLMQHGTGDPAVLEAMRNARQHAVARLVESLGCPDNPPPELRVALLGWASYVDSVTLDWVMNGDLELDYLTDICVQALVASVHGANSHPFGADEELQALEEVSLPPLVGSRPASS